MSAEPRSVAAPRQRGQATAAPRGFDALMALPIAKLAHQADQAGVRFWLHGSQVRSRWPVDIDGDLLTALHYRWRTLREHLSGGVDPDIPAISLLDQLGIHLLRPTTLAEAHDALAVIAGDAVRHALPELQHRPGLVGFDIETAADPSQEYRPPLKLRRDGVPAKIQPKIVGAAGLDPHRSHIRLCQLYAGGTHCLILDTNLLDLAQLRPLLQAFFAAHTLVIHNAAFELRCCLEAGLALPHFEDTMQASGLLHGVRHRSLEKSAYDMLTLRLPKALQTSDWADPRLRAGQLAYAAIDAIVTLQLWLKQRAVLLSKQRGPAYLLQRDVTPAVVRMTARGVGFDRARHQQEVAAWQADLAIAQQSFEATTGQPPPDKPVEIRNYLLQVLPPQLAASWPRTVKTKLLSTRAADLRRVTYLPAIQPLLDIAAKQKLLNSFGETLARRISARTGRLHPQFGIASTKAGRFSASAPNVQQIPKHRAPGLRSCFVAQDGYALVIADYSAMELRAAAAISGDPVMNQDFAAGIDPHVRQAAAMLAVPQNAITEAQRDHAKPINFMTIYGAGANGIVAAAWNNYGIVMTPEQAYAGRQLLLDRYRVYADWMVRNHAHCVTTGQIPIGQLGRVIEATWEVSAAVRERYGAGADDDIDGLDVEDDDDADADDSDEALFDMVGASGGPLSWSPASPPGAITEPLKYTLCCNAPVQGACADAGMAALLLIDAALQEAGIPGGPVLFVHDEIVLEVPIEHVALAAELLQGCMERGFAATFPGAPLQGLVSVRSSASWGKA